MNDIQTLDLSYDIPAAWREGIAMARKYACQGPRYTSYPTAPQFTEDFRLERYLNWQSRQGLRTEPLSSRSRKAPSGATPIAVPFRTLPRDITTRTRCPIVVHRSRHTRNNSSFSRPSHSSVRSMID